MESFDVTVLFNGTSVSHRGYQARNALDAEKLAGKHVAQTKGLKPKACTFYVSRNHGRVNALAA